MVHLTADQQVFVLQAVHWFKDRFIAEAVEISALPLCFPNLKKKLRNNPVWLVKNNSQTPNRSIVLEGHALSRERVLFTVKLNYIPLSFSLLF